MDLHPHNESDRLEQIVTQFLLKSLHIILDSRAPVRSHNGKDTLPSNSRAKRSDKWFGLVLSDRPAALDNLNFWHRNSMDPMIIDIILVQKGNGSSFEDVSSLGTSVETVIERWAVQYDSKPLRAPQVGDCSSYHKKTYKKSIVLLRSLYLMMRLLPAYKIFRQLSSSSQAYNFDIVYKVSSFCNPFSRAEEKMMKEYNFVPVEATPGNLCISVMYRSTLSEFNLQPAASFPPEIITNYVGSPATDPMRTFTFTGKGACAIYYPLRDVHQPSPSPVQRRHSWTNGFHKQALPAQNQTLGYSPPTNRASPMAYDFTSPSPPDIYTHRPQNFRPPTHHKATSYDEYQLSPPLSSSPSPSPPTYHSHGSPLQDRLRSETAPVTIPLPGIGRNPKYLSPCSSDPNRHSLPPPSPRGNRPDSSYQKSPGILGIKSTRKVDALRAGGELNTGMANHQSGLKAVNDSKDDSGRFSGLLSSSGSTRIGFSRSSSRLSFQDDLEDFDISGPFDVDDVDSSDSHSRKSQDAAVGALVHMLRTAPPLRQDRSFYSTHSLKNELEGDVGTVSGFFLPRKTSDALEELKSYKDIKDILLSKSEARVIGHEEA